MALTIASSNPHVADLHRLLPDLDTDVFRDLVLLGVESVQQETICEQRFRQMQSQTSLSPDDFAALFNGVAVIVRNLMRLPLHASKGLHQRRELITDLRIPAEKSVLLLDTVLGCSSRSHAVGPSSPVIRGVDWRFGLIRKRSERMEPGILLRIDTTAGPVVLRVGLTVFHKLRFSVAEAFSQLTNLRDKVHGN